MFFKADRMIVATYILKKMGNSYQRTSRDSLSLLSNSTFEGYLEVLKEIDQGKLRFTQIETDFE